MITYNQEAYIAQAIESIFSQKKVQVQIVVGDDASTDKTVSILKKLKKQSPFPFILIAREKNLGMHANFTDTYSHCEGKYIAMLEGDDFFLDTNKLFLQEEVLNNDPSIIACFHNVDVVDQHGQKKEKFFSTKMNSRHTRHDLLKGPFMPTASLMYRNNRIKEFPAWFSKTVVADWPLLVLLGQYGDYYYIDKPMSARRIHDTGVWGLQSKHNQYKGLISTAKSMLSILSKEEKAILRNTIAGYDGALAKLAFEERHLFSFLYYRLQQFYNSSSIPFY